MTANGVNVADFDSHILLNASAQARFSSPNLFWFAHPAHTPSFLVTAALCAHRPSDGSTDKSEFVS